ncbi:MAG: nucleotidyltransferase domain-containing protein [Planctomycetota bacterium]
MTEEERAILEDFKGRVSARLPLHRIILFGSRARGDADPDSDMDLLVVLDGQAGWKERRIVSECAWEASFGKGILLVPLTVSREEWENGPERSSLLAIAVEKDGIQI